MRMMKHWKILAKEVKGGKEIIQALLKNRGLETPEEIREFLNPPDPSVINPKLLEISTDQITRAVERIKMAIANREKIIVYGDYDADGICGSAILWETLRDLGADVLPYIPHRVEEGYGLSEKGINNLLSHKPYTIGRKPSLIITVDQGITAREEVDYAKEKGIDVIITDHHQKPEVLPKSFATVWTDKVSGAGVAWILAKVLTNLAPNPQFKTQNYLDLVAIATIADLLPLKGYNRSLVKLGLSELNKTERLGLLALAEDAGLPMGKIGVYESSFILAPRLNAAGRIEHALDSLRLLCTRNQEKAKILAQKLSRINQERQRLTEETLLHARTLVQDTSKLIFISYPSYNEGVIGLVAGKLTEEFWRPTIVVSEGKIHSKGSARSVNGFNIIETIRRFEEILVDCGGHPMAAGFTVKTAHLAELKERLLELTQKEIDQSQLEKILKIDCKLELSDINWPFYEELTKFEPFGNGNPEPVFLTEKVMIRDFRLVGNEGKHLKLSVTSSSGQPPSSLRFKSHSAIGFGFGEWGSKLKIGDQIDLVYSLLINSWNGEERMQLKIKDLKVSQ